MKEVKMRVAFSLATDIREILQKHADYGYADMSAMVAAGVRRISGEEMTKPEESLTATEIETLVGPIIEDRILSFKKELTETILQDHAVRIAGEQKLTVRAMVHDALAKLKKQTGTEYADQGPSVMVNPEPQAAQEPEPEADDSHAGVNGDSYVEEPRTEGEVPEPVYSEEVNRLARKSKGGKPPWAP